ncbi:MAG: ABC transporter substrate-binding protein [Oscillospiraceae bacterium]
MKKSTKFASVLMAGTMLIGCFAGCGKSPADTTPTPAGSAGGSSADTQLLLGGIGPLTGDYANYGTSVRNGAKQAVEEINAAGGVNGFEFVLDFQDSQGDPDSAVSAYGKLMDSGMDVSLGGTFSGENQSVVAAAKEDGILLLTPSASAKASIEGNDCAFRVCFNDPAQGTASADYIADNGLATKVAVFYGSDNDYCVGLYETFAAECAVKGIEVVEVQSFTDGTNTDFSTQINTIRDSGAELVFLPIYAAEASTFLTQAAGKLDVPYFGCDGLDGILTKVSDTALVEGVMMLTPFAADDPSELVQAFVGSYTTAHGAVPDQFAADGYDAVYAVKSALEKTGITPETKDDTFNAQMVAAMTEISVSGVTGTMTWTADGETSKAATAMIIKDGVSVVYTGK